MRADAAQGGGRDRGRGAVVEDEGRAGGVRFRCGRGGGVGGRGVGREGRAPDTAGELGGVGARFRADLDDGAGVGLQGLIARGGLGQDERVGGRGFSEGKLEVGGGGGWGGGGAGGGV